MGVVTVLVLIAHSTAVVDTDLETVFLTIAYGVPGCACGFTLVDAPPFPSTPPSPRGGVGDDGKETGNLGVASRKGGRDGQVGDNKPLNSVVLLDGGV